MQKMEETNPMLMSRDHHNNSKLPESPRLPMEFLSRSWSLPALQLSKALSLSLPSLLSKTVASCTTPNSNPNCNIPILEEEHHHSAGMVFSGELPEDQKRLISGNSFSFASSATSQLVLDRIMSQSEVSPMTSGRPSCSEPPNGMGTGMGGQSFSSSSLTPEMFDSPTSDPISPPLEFDKFLSSNSTTPQLLLPPIRVGPRTGGTTPGGGGGGGGGSTVGSKTVGRWLKERKEKKKEESRVHNAQVHAAVSVAAVAAAVAATASATAAMAGKDETAEQTDVAIATAATLVAARCVEAAEAMGAEREQLASVISSAVNVQSHGDIMTLTAAAATALRGAATLKARTMKEVCNIAAVLPVEKGLGYGNKGENAHTRNGSSNGDNDLQGENFLGLCNEELLARGSELLKRTRQGELHWKLVSVYLDKTGQVILKMKSRHVAGTITKKKKKVLMDVCKDMPTWPERRTIDTHQGEERRYFGLKTATHRVIQFECKTQQEYEVWTQGVSRLLSIAKEQRKTGTFSRNDMYWG